MNEIKFKISNDADEKYFNNQLKINISTTKNVNIKSDIKIDKTGTQTIEKEKGSPQNILKIIKFMNQSWIILKNMALILHLKRVKMLIFLVWLRLKQQMKI